ncbi:MAG: nodulation protein NfeD, partial [Deltaproteobacteria bacterium]|nr:nodulation protein NfeD [Deltaproteobacteria bacterium]
AWVGPSGARAASAGLFLVAAAHAAAMAPGTNLGAAHPVAIGGGADETVSKKAERDAAAYLRSLAQQRGRDGRWFEEAVTQSASISADEALRKGVVDLVARDVQELLSALDGRTIEISGAQRVLRTGGLEPSPVRMSARQRILQVLLDPNLVYLLMILGFLGIFFELSNPGSIFPGVIGGLALILAFVGLQTLSFNYAGVLLVLLALVLFLLEVKITSYGLLGTGGVVCLLLGSLLLFRGSPEGHRLRVGVILPAVAVTALFFVFVVGKGLAAQRRRPVSGSEALVGELGRAVGPLGPDLEGKVFVHGEYWNATAADPVPAGTGVEVLAVEGMRLLVRRAAQPGQKEEKNA